MCDFIARVLADIKSCAFQSSHSSHVGENIVRSTCVDSATVESGDGASERVEDRQDDRSSRLFCLRFMAAIYGFNIRYAFFSGLYSPGSFGVPVFSARVL